jgi:hypothetical protein
MSITEDFDRQQAFSAGFALAARDWNLSKPEYDAFCKIAAEMVIPITDQKQVDQQRVDNFITSKAQAVKGQAQPAAAPPLNKVSATAAPAVAPPAPPPVSDAGAVSTAPDGALAEGQRAAEQQRKATYARRLAALQARVKAQEQQGVAELDRSFGGNRPGMSMAKAQDTRDRNYYADMLTLHPELAADPKSDPKLVSGAQATIAKRPQPAPPRSPAPVQPPASAPVPAAPPKAPRPAKPSTTSPGSLSPALSKFLKNPSF